VAQVGPNAARVTAVAAGTATITASSGGVTGSAGIVVASQSVVASVAVTPTTENFVEGSSGFGAPVQLSTILEDINGNPLTGFAVTWSSSDTTAATVSSTGLLSPSMLVVTSTTATITATSADGKSGTAIVTVNPQVGSLVLPATLNVIVGQPQVVHVIPLDIHGKPLTNVPILWLNDHANVARLDRPGGDSVVVTGILPGVTTILASESVGGANASMVVTVTSAASAAVKPNDPIPRIR
jgi:uncharacterized protein YjdB